MENILEISGLKKSFKKNYFTLDDVSFSVPYGAVVGLIGENGAGKTTLIRLVMNIYAREAGCITGFGSADNIKDEAEFKERTGFVSDESYLYPGATVKETVRAFSTAFRDWDQSIFDMYADRWKLNRSARCGKLSKGEKIKLMFALSLAHKPELLILDEATSGLDPSARLEILELIRDFTEDGQHSVLMSTHITGDLDRIADYIALMIDGKIKEFISADKFQEKYVHVSGDKRYLKNELVLGQKINGDSYEAIALRKDTEKMYYADVRTLTFEEYLVHMMIENKERKTER